MTHSRLADGGPGKAGQVTAAICLLLLAASCAGSSFEAPAQVNEGPLRERAVTNSKENIRVSAAVPTPEEAQSIFGVDLGEHGIQPLWLEISNHGERRFVFLPAGIDPEYFAPLEAAYLYEDEFTDESYQVFAEHFDAASLDHRSLILPGETISGFVYINKVDPTLIVEIDLVGENWSGRFDLLVPLPGTDHTLQAVAALRGIYDESPIVDIEDEEELRKALEALPCCTSNMMGTSQDLPLNLVVIGEIADIAPPFGRRQYRYRVVEPAYVFGRQQDFSAKKTSRWIAPQPHVIRAWLAPLRFRGQPITIMQVSMPSGGRFTATTESKQPIEPDLDIARNDVVQDLIYSQSLAKIGFVKAFARGATPDDAAYQTDGLRAVLRFTDEPVSLAEIDFFDWERLVDYQRKAKTK